MRVKAGTGRLKTISGFVVKKEYWVTEPTSRARVKHRDEVSRIYHSRDAANTLRDILQKRNEEADVHYYVHEKGKSDDVTLF